MKMGERSQGSVAAELQADGARSALDLEHLEYLVEAERPDGRYGGRGHHWRENGELQGYGGKLDMRLAVLAGIDDEIRTLWKVSDYYVASQ